VDIISICPERKFMRVSDLYRTHGCRKQYAQLFEQHQIGQQAKHTTKDNKIKPATPPQAMTTVSPCDGPSSQRRG
jgi:hypothetical protein